MATRDSTIASPTSSFIGTLSGDRDARINNAPARALHERRSESCDDEAISDSDIGRVRITNNHGAAPPAKAIAAAPTMMADIPINNRDNVSVWSIVNRPFPPLARPAADGR